VSLAVSWPMARRLTVAAPSPPTRSGECYSPYSMSPTTATNSRRSARRGAASVTCRVMAHGTATDSRRSARSGAASVTRRIIPMTGRDFQFARPDVARLPATACRRVFSPIVGAWPTRLGGSSWHWHRRADPHGDITPSQLEHLAHRPTHQHQTKPVVVVTIVGGIVVAVRRQQVVAIVVVPRPAPQHPVRPGEPLPVED
jgi:hypothetical protein